MHDGQLLQRCEDTTWEGVKSGPKSGVLTGAEATRAEHHKAAQQNHHLGSFFFPRCPKPLTVMVGTGKASWEVNLGLRRKPRTHDSNVRRRPDGGIVVSLLHVLQSKRLLESAPPDETPSRMR